MIDCAEDREHFQKMLHRLGLKQPPNRTARTAEAALAAAREIGYPLVVRPSYVLGGRAMEIIHEQGQLERYMHEAVKVSHDSPVLLDRFVNDAVEVDVDAICDGEAVLIGGIMEHIEQAGVHSGDSACSLPPFSLCASLQDELRRQTSAMAHALNVVGLMNVQFAIQGNTVYVLEVNPRASRTVPFVSKATGLQLAKISARCMTGITLARQGVVEEVIPSYYSVKEAVFPFIKFPGVDTILGPEMKSTGEVMGVGQTFAEAFVKSQLGAGVKLPRAGKVFISVRQSDKPRVVEIARNLAQLGFTLYATRGTAAVLSEVGLTVTPVNKMSEGRPHIVDMIKNGEMDLIINTVEDKRSAVHDSYSIRHAVLQARVTYYTTLAGARAACIGMASMRELHPYSLQELHESMAAAGCRVFPENGFTSEIDFKKINGSKSIMSTIPLTVVGAEKLRAELHELKTVQRPAVITAIAEARAHGDLSENAEYEAAKGQAGFYRRTHCRIGKQACQCPGHRSRVAGR